MSKILKAKVFTVCDSRQAYDTFITIMLSYCMVSNGSLTLRNKTANKQWYFMLPVTVNTEAPAYLPVLTQLPEARFL